MTDNKLQRKKLFEFSEIYLSKHPFNLQVVRIFKLFDPLMPGGNKKVTHT